MHHPHLLAAYTSQSIFRIAIPLLFLLLLSAVLVGALAVVRRKMHEGHMSHAPRDFSLGDLRRLHREGKLNDEEFARAKAKLVGSMQATLKKETKPSMVEQPVSEELKDV